MIGEQELVANAQSLRSPGDVPEAIQWHEGMLLSPQHFQQLAWRQEELLSYQMASLHPCPYGVRRLRINSTLLADEKFKIDELEAVMPDGLLVSLGENEGPSVDLGAVKEFALSSPLTIYLGVRRRGRDDYLEAFRKRYASIDGSEVADENTGEGLMNIPRLRPQIRLFGKEPGARYASFPIARVEWINNHFELRRDFIPPLLEIIPPNPNRPDSPLSALYEQARSLVDQLRQRARYLSNRLRSEMRLRDPMRVMETREAIRSLVVFLPQFEAILHTPGMHPYQLWLALCNIIGGLATIGADSVPRPITRGFDPENLLESFVQGSNYIRQLVDEGVPEDYRSFRFLQDPDDARVFRIDLAWDWLDASDYLLIGVRPRQGVSETEVRDWLSRAYICSAPRLEELETGRLRGAHSEVADGQDRPAASRETVLFRIERSLQYIQAGEPLVIFNKSDRGKPIAADITLFVKEGHETNYCLSKGVLTALVEVGLPEDVVESIRVLKDRAYASRDVFAAELRELIGNAVDQYQSQLFKLARVSEQGE